MNILPALEVQTADLASPWTPGCHFVMPSQLLIKQQPSTTKLGWPAWLRSGWARRWKIYALIVPVGFSSLAQPRASGPTGIQSSSLDIPWGKLAGAGQKKDSACVPATLASSLSDWANKDHRLGVHELKFAYCGLLVWPAQDYTAIIHGALSCLTGPADFIGWDPLKKATFSE